jgi:hypothetical protein
MIKRITIALLLFHLSLLTFAQLPFDVNSCGIFGQIKMTFSKPDWRSGEGAADLFGRSGNDEYHVFYKGAVLDNVKPVFTVTDSTPGPYAHMDEWANLAMLRTTNSGNFFKTIKYRSGLIIWLMSEALSKHEKEYDTKVLSHFIIYAPNWPGKQDFQAYYIEDHMIGVGMIFRNLKCDNLELKKEEDRYYFSGTLTPYLELYETQSTLSLEFSGMCTTKPLLSK